MPSNSICNFSPPSSSFAYIEAQSLQGNKHFVLDKTSGLAYVLEQTGNTTGAEFKLHSITQQAIKELGITFIEKIIHCTGQMPKEPVLANAIIGQYNTTCSIPNRFRAIADLNQTEKTHYKQLSNLEQTNSLRSALLSLIDEDMKVAFEVILKEWMTYGVSASEVDLSAYSEFKSFYDVVMENHAVIKEDYSKVDFSAQNIKPRITDPRCLNAKLTPLHIFKAAFQLGDIPAVSNFRFMDNPASKDDGKYREWMFHVDNSNYSAEFKIITTRETDTLKANQEQCLAAFPYDTTQFIRFTNSEAATKFPTLESLEKEFRDVPGARYITIKNPHNDTPIEAGIRTEMIAHHRSASNKSGLDVGESRSAELMTFHGLDRCQPFLSPEELTHAAHLTPLQHYVLGGFKNSGSETFMENMKNEKQTLNTQLRNLLKNSGIKQLDSITLATFHKSGTVILDKPLFQKQMDTYNDLPEVLEKIPHLTQDNSGQKETLLTIVPMLMNFDQNAELKPDCSENKAFPARTQIRERTNEDFHAPLTRDIEKVEFSNDPNHLLPMETIISINRHLHDFYVEHSSKLKSRQHDSNVIGLFESRAALAKEYISQLPSRATLPETHQTISLFMYYMADDLDKACQTLIENGIEVNNTIIGSIKKQQIPLLQHFITYRMLNDSISS